MKILILGDIHGRLTWKEIIEKENPDKVIFLGDYVSSHDYIYDKQQIDNLEEILQYKEANPENVILMRGNHDLEALGYYWAECSPSTSKEIHQYMTDNKERFLNDTQWLYQDGDVIYCHAGITKPWFEKVKKYHKEVSTFEDINKLEPSELFGFSSDNRWDCYGTGETQPLTWVRPQTLLENGENALFVVGHTTQQRDGFPKFITYQSAFHNEPNKEETEIQGLWLCDVLGYGGYLLNVDGIFISKNLWKNPKE